MDRTSVPSMAHLVCFGKKRTAWINAHPAEEGIADIYREDIYELPMDSVRELIVPSLASNNLRKVKTSL